MKLSEYVQTISFKHSVKLKTDLVSPDCYRFAAQHQKSHIENIHFYSDLWRSCGQNR